MEINSCFGLVDFFFYFFFIVRHCLMPLQLFVLNALNSKQNMQLLSLRELFVLCLLKFT